MSAPVDALPVIGWEPLQSPDAAHEVAFAELQLRAEELPLTTLVGLAVKVTVGAAGAVVVVAGVVGADDVEPPPHAVTVTVAAKTKAMCVLARANLGIVGSSFFCANSDTTTVNAAPTERMTALAAWFSAQPLAARISGGMSRQEHYEIITPRVACLQLVTMPDRGCNLT